MAITLFLDEGLSTAHPEFVPVWAAFPEPTDPFPPLEARRAFWDDIIIPNLNKFLEPSLPSGQPIRHIPSRLYSVSDFVVLGRHRGSLPARGSLHPCRRY